MGIVEPHDPRAIDIPQDQRVFDAPRPRLVTRHQAQPKLDGPTVLEWKSATIVVKEPFHLLIAVLFTDHSISFMI
jgi:hypothetical protein